VGLVTKYFAFVELGFCRFGFYSKGKFWCKTYSLLIFAVNTDMKWLLGVIIGTLICISFADNENARLLASKNILNLYMVENKDLTVEYQIYNVGGR